MAHEYVAAAVKVPASDLALHEWEGRTSKAHRTDADRVRTALLAHLKDDQIEPPSKQRMQRIVGSALDQSEKVLTLRISSRISDDVIQRSARRSTGWCPALGPDSAVYQGAGWTAALVIVVGVDSAAIRSVGRAGSRSWLPAAPSGPPCRP
ncbi:hypothetical protein GCM10010149_36760 [Nonomuraea roseoviolacea subsp. roseoviolacea]